MFIYLSVTCQARCSRSAGLILLWTVFCVKFWGFGWFWLVLVEDFRHLKPGVTATPTDIDLEAKSLSGIRCCFCLLLAKSKACCVFSYFSARNLRVRHGCIPACFYWFYCFDLLSSSILTQSMVHVPDRPVTACTRKTLKMSSFESSS